MIDVRYIFGIKRHKSLLPSYSSRLPGHTIPYHTIPYHMPHPFPIIGVPFEAPPAQSFVLLAWLAGREILFSRVGSVVVGSRYVRTRIGTVVG